MLKRTHKIITVFHPQILCARGYSDQLSGMSNSLILLVGTLASFPFGVLAYKGFQNSIWSLKTYEDFDLSANDYHNCGFQNISKFHSCTLIMPNSNGVSPLPDRAHDHDMQGVLLLRRRRNLCALLPHENTRPGMCYFLLVIQGDQSGW